MRILVSLLLCLFALPSWAAWVGQASNYGAADGTTLTVTRTVTSGNYLLVVANAYQTSDISISFATTAGTTSGWTEIAAADFYDTGDDVMQEAAWATASATGSTTVTVTFGGTVQERSVVLVELSSISGFDVAQYARSTSATGGTAGLSNTNAAATRVVHVNSWGGGNATATSPYTDGGALSSGYHRTQYINETSIQSRTGAFGAGATQPIHITQFIFSETAGSPAVLSSPTPSGTLGTTTTATIGATTDQTTGTFYAVVDNAGGITGITAAQIIAGNDSGGVAAIAACNAAVSTTTPSCGTTGLTAGTAYSYAAVQNNANGDSNVVTGTFTTAAGGGSGILRQMQQHHGRNDAANDDEYERPLVANSR